MPDLTNSGNDIRSLPTAGHKIAFVHGRPGPHPFHRKLADAVGSDFYFVDFIMRWHDRRTSRLYRYLSAIVCSLFFPSVGNYKLIISEGLHVVPVLAKKFRFFSRRPKTAALMASETLYFLKTSFYSDRTSRLLLKTLSNYDALVCVGAMQAELAKGVLVTEPRKPQIFHIAGSATTAEREKRFASVIPDFRSTNILFIANGVIGWRAWYKGIDILLQAIGIVGGEIPEIKLNIVGEWSDDDISEISRDHPEGAKYSRFVGQTPCLEKYFQMSSLYVHIGRGDAFPVSILESMLAGLPCVVSEWTGAKAAVGQVDEKLIVPVDARKVVEKIKWYLNLPLQEKQRLSNRSREIARQYSEAGMLAEFRGIVSKLIES